MGTPLLDQKGKQVSCYKNTEFCINLSQLKR